MILSSVLLPQPLWPTIVTNSASATANETSDSAWTGPSRDGYTLLRLRTSIVPRRRSSPWPDVYMADRRRAGGSLERTLVGKEIRSELVLMRVVRRDVRDAEGCE